MQYFETAPQVIAFFEKGKDVAPEEISRIKSDLEKTGKLADFKYVSIHEAEAIYKEKGTQRPVYQGDLPEGNDGLGLMLLGVTGEDVLSFTNQNGISGSYNA